MTADGTEVGQIAIAELDESTVWTVDVVKQGEETCVTSTANGATGAVCAPHWGDLPNAPQSTFVGSSVHFPGRTMVVIISPPDRTVGLAPRGFSEEPVAVESLAGVNPPR